MVSLTDQASRVAVTALMGGGSAHNAAYTVKSQDVIGDLVYWANNGDILKTFNQLAQSLTNHMRSGPQSTDHIGRVLRNELYMRVDWPWLAYPVALLVAVSTHVLSRGRDEYISAKE
jgi:hypothetical protein